MANLFVTVTGFANSTSALTRYQETIRMNVAGLSFPFRAQCRTNGRWVVVGINWFDARLFRYKKPWFFSLREGDLVSYEGVTMSVFYVTRLPTGLYYVCIDSRRAVKGIFHRRDLQIVQQSRWHYGPNQPYKPSL